MVPDSLWRLRLKYEDSLEQCDLCGRRGIVGADIKLVLPGTVEYTVREEGGTAFLFRCADPSVCHN
jgi:hypothetical protein